MTDMITAEEAQKLLDGTTPGPWEADGDPQNRIVWSPDGNRVCFMAHSSGLNDNRDIATSNLVAAAPDLARTVIALHAQLADAKAARKLAEERLAKTVEALGACIASLERADTSEGVCCCGDNMDGHANPMTSGHIPVDMGDYYARSALEAAHAILKEIDNG